MIDLAVLDLLARGGALGILALWSVLLWRDARGQPAAQAALLMNLAIAGHILADMHNWYGYSGAGIFVLRLLQSAAPGCIWLFVRIWFDDKARFGGSGWAAIAFSACSGGAVHLFRVLTGTWSIELDVFQRVVWLGFVGAALFIVWRGRDSDLIETRRRVRIRFVLITSATTAAITISGFIFNLTPGVSTYFQVATSLMVVLSALYLFSSIFGLRASSLFVPPEPAPIRPAMAEDDPLMARLHTHMDTQKPHRDETMTIAKLAAQLGEQEYRLRRLINGRLRHRNFAAFLNGYRLDEVKHALADQEQRGVPILTIALDAGFGSLGPFNRAFREAEGMTPTDYRQTHG